MRRAIFMAALICATAFAETDCRARYAALFNHLVAKGALSADDVAAFLTHPETNPLRVASRLGALEAFAFAQAFDALVAEGRLKKADIVESLKGVAHAAKAAGERREKAQAKTAWLTEKVVRETNLSGSELWDVSQSRAEHGVLMVESMADNSGTRRWTVLAPGGKPLQLKNGVEPSAVVNDGGRLLVSTILWGERGPVKVEILDARTGQVVQRHTIKNPVLAPRVPPPAALFYRRGGALHCLFAWDRKVEGFDVTSGARVALPQTSADKRLEYVARPDGQGVLGYGVFYDAVAKRNEVVIRDGVTGDEIYRRPHDDSDAKVHLYVSRKGEITLAFLGWDSATLVDVARDQRRKVTLPWEEQDSRMAQSIFDEDPAGKVGIVYRVKNEVVRFDARSGNKTRYAIPAEKGDEVKLPFVFTREGGEPRIYVPVSQGKSQHLVILGDDAPKRLPLDGDRTLALTAGPDGQVGVLERSEDARTDSYRLSLTQIRGPSTRP